MAKSHHIFYPLCSFVFLSMALACEKHYMTPNGTHIVSFTNTIPDSLGTYDSLGRPNYLEPHSDHISDSLQQFILQTLPKGKDETKLNPEFFTSNAMANIDVTQTSTVYITFVQETAKYLNTLGFYTYPTNTAPTTASQIQKITYVFPNISAVNSGGALNPGDKVNIGTFSPGTSIGFVLLQDAWTPKTHSINTNAIHLCSQDVLNPENDPNIRRHVIIVPYAPQQLNLISFEDQLRTDPLNDNDFDDVTIYTTTVAH